MKTEKVQPLYSTMFPPARIAWEKNNLPPGQTLENIAKENWKQFRVILECLAIMVGMMLYTADAVLILILLGPLIALGEIRNNKLQAFAHRFEKEAKELGLENCSPLQGPSYPVRQRLILAAMNFLVAKTPFELKMKMTYKEGYEKGKFAKECKEKYKRLLALAMSFGLATGDWNEHFGPAQEQLDTARE